MLDFKLIIEKTDYVKQALKKKGHDVDFTQVIEKDAEIGDNTKIDKSIVKACIEATPGRPFNNIKLFEITKIKRTSMICTEIGK